jgi:hypothetical protein
MDKHNASAVVGKLKMKLTLIQHSLQEMDKDKLIEHVERASDLIVELKELSYKL